MTGRWRAALVVAALTAAVTVMPGGPTPSVAADAPPTTTPVSNEFVPADANIGDCVSALPRPGCGSEARGGWRQTLILGVLVAGLGLIGWRIVAGLRARRPHGGTPS